jgi:hypothetical protein
MCVLSISKTVSIYKSSRDYRGYVLKNFEIYNKTKSFFSLILKKKGFF